MSLYVYSYILSRGGGGGGGGGGGVFGIYIGGGVPWHTKNVRGVLGAAQPFTKKGGS